MESLRKHISLTREETQKEVKEEAWLQEMNDCQVLSTNPDAFPSYKKPSHYLLLQKLQKTRPLGRN